MVIFYDAEISSDFESEKLVATSRIVCEYVRNNSVAPAALPDLVHDIYAALSGNTPSTKGMPAATVEPPVPAVPIKRSVFPGYIICLEDGQKQTLLKRYLKRRYNLTPEQYRERWGLPGTYPMVAPNYTLRRAEIARSIGLGRKAGGFKRR